MRTILAAILAASLFTPLAAWAHCDSLDSPVVVEAQAALDKGDVTPVLKWVRPADEKELRAAFAQTLTVRKLGPDAKALADRAFFDTLVRIHRAGENAPYTGLKAAGTTDPVTLKLDEALAKGDIEPFLKQILAHTGDSIRQRFAKAVAAQKRKDESVEAGREFVAAYVDYVHYVERVVQSIHASGHAH